MKKVNANLQKGFDQGYRQALLDMIEQEKRIAVQVPDPQTGKYKKVIIVAVESSDIKNLRDDLSRNRVKDH